MIINFVYVLEFKENMKNLMRDGTIENSTTTTAPAVSWSRAPPWTSFRGTLHSSDFVYVFSKAVAT